MKRAYFSVRLWLSVAALTTTVAFLLSYRSIRQSEASNASVDNTQQRLSALIGLESSTADLIFSSNAGAISAASDIALKRLDELDRLYRR